MQRTGWIVVGASIVATGLAMIAFSGQFLVGGMLAVAGVLRLMTAFSMDSRQVRAHPAAPDDPRWLPDRVKRSQVVGRSCTECGRRITVASDGVCCAVCDEPAHLACNDLHRSHAHRPDAVGPFR